tara:strand:- start:264 stop:641 length:378 start_codon:yes stop_codon:yes gene_type:complete
MSNVNRNIAMHKHWSSLVGMSGTYEGADSQEFLFKFDGIVWEAIADEMDGYRSCLEYVVYGGDKNLIEYTNLARVTIEKSDCKEFVGYILKDSSDNHVWLEVGTNYTDDWYPYFVFKHNPKLVSL